MQKHSSLSELRSEYDQGKLERKKFEGLIFQYLLNNYDQYRFFNGDRERWIDFISWLYPRLSRAVDLYRDTGATFDTYVNSIIQWASREYRASEAAHRTTEYVCWKARAEERETMSREPCYFEDEPDDEKVNELFPLAHFNSRQILILFLKSYFFVSRNFAARVAETIGMKKEKLEALVDTLHHIRAQREIRIHFLKESIYSQYYRCLSFQKRLSLTTPGTAKHEKIKNYLERAQKRFAAMNQRFKRIRVDATNRQIAEILGIPKGTVDSTLYGIREKWKTITMPLAAKENDRYDEICSATATASMRAMPQMS